MQTPSLGKRRPGFTLAEILVVSGLAFLLLLLTVQFILPVMRLSMRAQDRTQLQQICYLALTKLRSDFEATNAAAIGLVNQGPGETSTILAMQPVEPQMIDAHPAYKKELVCYYWTPSEGKLWRKVYRPDGFSFDSKFATRLGLSQLHTLPALTGAQDARQLANDVSEFSLSSSVAAPNIGNPLKVKLTLKRVQDNCTLEQTIVLRNSP